MYAIGLLPPFITKIDIRQIFAITRKTVDLRSNQSHISQSSFRYFFSACATLHSPPPPSTYVLVYAKRVE